MVVRLSSTVLARAMPPPAIRRIGAVLLDMVLPPRCLACGALVDAAHALCAECWPKIRFITEPLCAACGTPFEFEPAAGSVCAACAASERPFARARAAIAYDDGSRGFILAFKHGDRTDAARVFAPWMAQAGRELLADADLLVPVPLHWTRLFMRRYNQAALLAQAVGRLGREESRAGHAGSPQAHAVARTLRRKRARQDRQRRVHRAAEAPPARRGQTHSSDRRCLHDRLDHRRLRSGAGEKRRSFGRRPDARARRAAKPPSSLNPTHPRDRTLKA